MRWPWQQAGTTRTAVRHEERDLEERAFEMEAAAMDRDIKQIKMLNEYLLNRALADGRLDEATAAAIRATQAYETEVLDLGQRSH
jgi:hypothetical protein